jgi:plasmid stability protein
MEYFTKGEWKVRNTIIQITSRIEVLSRDLLTVGINPEKDSTFKAVAICGFKRNRTVKANAKLIAAAPDLLKACIEAEKHHKGYHSEVGDLLRAAIKKAIS